MSQRPQGSIWDYHGQQRDRAWIVAPQEDTAAMVQDWLRQMTRGRWFGEHYMILDPDSEQTACFTHKHNKASLQVTM